LPNPTKQKIHIEKPRTTQFFMHVPELKSVEERIYDPKIRKDCIYDVGTGLRAWVRVYSQSGQVLKETSYKTAPRWEDFNGDDTMSEASGTTGITGMDGRVGTAATTDSGHGRHGQGEGVR